MTATKYTILLYYKYINIENPENVRDEQKRLCNELGLKGRIILAKEGINGTVEGSHESTERYIAYMNDSKYFGGIQFKKSPGTGDAFPKLSIKARPEIVTTNIKNLDPTKVTGAYLTAGELHSWFETGKEFYIVDMRNDFEYASGYFEGFIPSGMKNFYNLQEALPKLNHLKDKTLVTVCTGGIRCEKASGFLLQNGFSDVYQLKDGIVSYMEQFPNEHFKGKLYVFDKRLVMGINIHDPKHEVVGKCDTCSEVSEQYVNCAYHDCHRHYISCNNCLDRETTMAFCNMNCKKNYFRFTLNKIQNPNGTI